MANMLTKGAGPRAADVTRSRPPVARTILLLGFSVYFLVPLWWLFVASTKTNSGLFDGSAGALWFDQDFHMLGNIGQLFGYSDGIYWRWIANSFLYSLVGGTGAMVLAVLAGYGFAKYNFRGRRLAFSILLGAVMVPTTALVLPIFIMFSQIGMNNTIWAVILPSMLSPFGVYLMRVYAAEAIPDELLDAARVDGASDIRVFLTVALPLLRPAIATVLLLSVVATWNNYFLPVAVLNDPNLFPVTVGLGQWLQTSASTGGTTQLWNLIITGAFVSILPLIAAFLLLQRFWQGGLSIGSLK